MIRLKRQIVFRVNEKELELIEAAVEQLRFGSASSFLREALRFYCSQKKITPKDLFRGPVVGSKVR